MISIEFDGISMLENSMRVIRLSLHVLKPIANAVTSWRLIPIMEQKPKIARIILLCVV